VDAGIPSPVPETCRAPRAAAAERIGLGALQPAAAVVIDYVLQQHPIPEPFAGWLLAVHGGDRFTP
jgi:hypothetical protein